MIHTDFERGFIRAQTIAYADYITYKGKQTLRTREISIQPACEISASELIALRERLHISRPVFAGYLRTNLRTLENWEQGRAKPNAQASLLIRLVGN